MKNKIKKFLVKGNLSNQDNRKSAGITLVALVVTIVILIILAAVAINLSLGNNGIFNRAKTAKEQYQNAEDQEQTEVAKATNQIDSFVGGNRETVTIPKEEYEMLKNANSFSTEEKAIGNWIDGKTLYKKVVVDTLPNSGYKRVSLAALNISSVIDIQGIMKFNNISYEKMFGNVGGSNSGYDAWYIASETTLYIRNTRSDAGGYPCWITIQYTKTTD